MVWLPWFYYGIELGRPEQSQLFLGYEQIKMTGLLKKSFEGKEDICWGAENNCTKSIKKVLKKKSIKEEKEKTPYTLKMKIIIKDQV